MRKSEIARKTGETEITLQLNLDGTGQYQIQTGGGFLDHMLTGFARHGSFDLAVQCQGDTWVDDHHTVEDVGICLGQAFAQALGDLRGVERFGHSVLPMDEALILAAVDLSGRGCSAGMCPCPRKRWGPLTRNWSRSSGWPLPARPAAPSTCASWRGRTATTSLKGCSKPPDGA